MSEPFDIMIEIAKVIDPSAWNGTWSERASPYEEHLRNQSLNKAGDIMRLIENMKPVTSI